MGWLYLFLSLVGAWLTYNTYRPIYAPAGRAAVSFFAGWLTAELALHHIVVQALVTAAFVWWGAMDGLPGKLGLAVTILSWGGLGLCYLRGLAAAEAVERALREGLGADYPDLIPAEIASKLSTRVGWGRVVHPFRIRHRDVERVRDIVYRRVAGLNLKLDVYRHRSHPVGCPVLLEVHGGAWILGSKNEQGIPLMLRAASQGWVCVAANYRLSPHATFPDHLIDLKHAIRWIREHGAEYGANPDFIVVMGQSAGGHLASLLALTANEPELQPGFETVDTRLAGCISFYGVYDFTNRHGLWPNDGLAQVLEERVLKASLEEAREAYEKASPMSRIHPDAPPVLIVHGDLDTLVPVAEARRFYEALKAASRAPVVYAEIPGAQHAFELFPSLRTELTLAGVERFLAHVYGQHVTRQLAAAAKPFAAVTAAAS